MGVGVCITTTCKQAGNNQSEDENSATPTQFASTSDNAETKFYINYKCPLRSSKKVAPSKLAHFVVIVTDY